jgi:hypothetical protein
MTFLRAALLLNCIKLLSPRVPAHLSLPSRSFMASATSSNPLLNPSFLPRYHEIMALTPAPYPCPLPCFELNPFLSGRQSTLSPA